MEGNAISGWCISQKQGEEESIEGYLKAWDAVKELDIGPSHINLAAEIANRFMSGGHYANMVHFINSLEENFLEKMKGNEKFARSLIALKMTQRKYDEVFTLLENGQWNNKEGLLEMWDEAHYREWEERMGKPLNALLRYRIRQRFLPPQHICPNGTRPTTRLPDEALKILKEWLVQHPNDPYPSKIDKDVLMKKSGLSLSQVKTWFANARRRLRLKKEKRDKGLSNDGEGMSGSEQEGSSDSPEDAFSGEDIVKQEVEAAPHATGVPGGEIKEEHENHVSGFIPYPRNVPSYKSLLLSPHPPQSLACGPPEQRLDEWVEHSVYPTSTANRHVSLFEPGRVSTSYVPCRQVTQTSEYLKAMAGMCEDITPSTYQLGAPRHPKHTICHTLSDLQSLQNSRTPVCGVLQEDTYPSYQEQSQQTDHTVYPSRMGDAFAQRSKKWYQGHEGSRVRSYSASAPPSLTPITPVSTFQHPTTAVMAGMLRDQLQDPKWSAYQTTYTQRCFVCCRGQCSGCQSVADRIHKEKSNISLPSYGMSLMGTNSGLPVLHHGGPVTSVQDMTPQPHLPEGYREWTPMKRVHNDQQRGPLPAFHTSFDIMKLPVPAFGHLYEHSQTDNSVKSVNGHGYPSLRIPELPPQSNQASISSLRRRHKSQPATPSEPVEAPVRFRNSPSPSRSTPRAFTSTHDQVKSDNTELFRKRSLSITESDAKGLKYLKHKAYQSQVATESTKMFAMAPSPRSAPNGNPAHVKHVSAANTQLSPPDAHVHQKPRPALLVDREEPLSSTSLDPSLSTHTQANLTESREGMKEIAQVLLDLSTKGSKTDS